MNYYEHHLGDYAAATAHLSWDEDMAYTRLLRAYYHHERPILLDQAYRMARATTRQHKEAVDTVLAEFFVVVDGAWVQKRADAEIARYQDKQRKASASANARWNNAKPHSEGNADAMRTHMRTHSEGNAPNHQTPDPSKYKPASQVPGCAVAATPPPPFDGNNGEALNGKSIVALAPGWELPEQWGNDAEALGWQPVEVLREAEKFRQYWVSGRGQGKRRSVRGWRQSWATWLGKAERNR